MKTMINLKKGSREARFLYIPTVKSLLVSALILAGIQTPVVAQDSIVPNARMQEAQYTRPSWMFGVAGGANFNFYRGSTRKLNDAFTPPATFHDGQGTGLFIAPLIEYRPADSRWGLMLQVGYDNRKGFFDEVATPCNCIADLSANISYLTVEPSLRFAPFKSNFYIFGGPRLAFNMAKSFNYQLGLNPLYPDQLPTADVNGDLSSVNKNIISMQIGAGYDIQLSSKSHQTQFVISPFVSFQPYFGQNPRSIETLNLTTLRVGATFKFGRGHRVNAPAPEYVPVVQPMVEPEVQFSVNAPANVSNKRNVREIFPLSNYVFFDAGSTQISKRYVLLRKDQVKDFSEDQVKLNAPENLTGRSDRQMIVYYNVLNILGDRMVKDPSSTIVLVGSSEKGPADGQKMAQTVKNYLVVIFGIIPSRISVDGRYKPKIPSEKPGSTIDLVLLREGDRRVTIESNSPTLLMEFQNGNNAQMKPVVIPALQVPPVESYVQFNNKGASEAFESWTLEIKDDQGNLHKYGPYTQDQVAIDSRFILGERPEGDYTVTMIGKTKNGTVVRKTTQTHMVLWTLPKSEDGMRFSIIYEFDQSKAIRMYEKYLAEVVTPKIPMNGTVIIHGHTDITGDDAYNQKLSLARANDVKSIIGKGLAKAHRTDVKFEVYGYGEDTKESPFENKYPEGRFYNRTVIVDIVPQN